MSSILKSLLSRIVIAFSIIGQPTFAQECSPVLAQEIIGSDTVSLDQFGFAIAMSGRHLLVGAPEHRIDGFRRGAAYVFDISNPYIPLQVRKLVSENPQPGDRFGEAVAMTSTHILVSAPEEELGGQLFGAVYLFDAETGERLFRFTPDDTEFVSDFGVSVALSHAFAIVGAPKDRDNGIWAGAVYIYDLQSGALVRKLYPDDSKLSQQFGNALAVAGNHLVVGALDDDRGQLLNAGAAYVFDLGTYAQLSKLTAMDADGADFFGCSVAASGTVAIVGSYNDDDAGDASGAAYVYDMLSGTQLKKLTASDASPDNRYGLAVALSGDLAVVGASFDDNPEWNSGSAYLVEVPMGIELHKFSEPAMQGLDQYGHAVAIEGDTAVVSSLVDGTGSVFIYDLNCVEPFRLAFTGGCPGQARFSVAGATPTGQVVFVLGFGDRAVVPPGLPCAGMVLDVGGPALTYVTRRADSLGQAVVTGNLPASACGRARVQAMDLSTCGKSNVVVVD